MDNYSKVLTFFMEHGIQLTSDQLEALKEEFLNEGRGFREVERKIDNPEKINDNKKDSNEDNYKKIAPESGMKFKQANDYWDNFFGNLEKENSVNEAAVEILKDKQVIDTKFFGKPVKVTIHFDSYFGGEFDKKQSAAANKALNTFCNNKGLFGYLYNLHKSMFDEINSDSYYEKNQKVNNAQDLIDSVNLKYGLNLYCNPWRDDKSKFTIFVCGEYWCDDEHGFCVTFPQGNVVKVKDPRDAYDKNWNAIGTKIGQASDPL